MRGARWVRADAWWLVTAIALGLAGATLAFACHVTPLPVPNRQDWDPAEPEPDPLNVTGRARDAGPRDASGQ